MKPTAAHRVLNLAQSVLLIAGMAVLAWAIVTTIAGTGMTLAIMLGTVIGLFLAPSLPKRILLSAYNARRMTGATFPEGIALVAELSRRAGLPRVPTLYYVPSQTPNAFAIGSPEDSAICVTDGLLRLLNQRELAGVLAHETAHIANRDLWIMGVADAMSRAVSLASWFGQVILLVNLPLILSGAAYVPWHIPLLLMLSPTIMALMQLALSRTREFDADRGSVELTGDPEGLASALLKLERSVGRFWEEIFLPGRRIPEPSLLRTHPPTDARIERLRALKGASTTVLNEKPLQIGFNEPSHPPRFGPWGIYR